MSARAKKPSAPGKKNVLVVDDHPLTREGLSALINREPDLQVCGEAGSAREVMAALDRQIPDLVLLDLNLPDKEGLELLKDMQALHPRLPVLALSMFDEDIYATRVLRAGGRGFVSKREGGAKVLGAIRKVLDGQPAVSEQMVAQVLEWVSGRNRMADNAPDSKLSDREVQVLRLHGEGWSKVEIGKHLNISPKTVEAHRAAIREKLGLRSHAEFLRYAIRWANAQR